jgi:1-phosphatidylinositol-4-phosphate 5-kinase
LKHGLGEYRWASGNLYKGEYKFDKRDGYGQMKWADGSSFEGNWKNGV